MSELKWIDEARKHIGLREVPGAGNNPTISKWLKELGAWWADDATPWCGVFVAHCLLMAERKPPKNWFRAREYEQYGTRLVKPAYGCLAVFSRTGGGHVGFVVGEDAQGRLLILGGNQSDGVNIAAFDRARATAFVWPEDANGGKRIPAAARYKLPKGMAAASKRED